MRDVADLQAEDVLQPRRQREIEELVSLLQKFNPTKVAVEVEPSGDSKLQGDYQRYLSEGYLLKEMKPSRSDFASPKVWGIASSTRSIGSEIRRVKMRTRITRLSLAKITWRRRLKVLHVKPRQALSRYKRPKGRARFLIFFDTQMTRGRSKKITKIIITY